jgi:hypothetical protein
VTRTIDVDYQVIEAPREVAARPADLAVHESRARGWWLAALALAVAWFLYAIPWLFHGYVIPWDAKDYYYPVLRFLAASLAQGEPGEWNPYLYSGFPAIADPQSWFFTPTFRLFAALDAAPTMTRMDAVELFHLLLGAFGLLLLCRALGLRPLAATIAGFVFMFGGVAASRLQHTLMIVSYAWLPWAILLLTLACDSPRRNRRLIYAAVFGVVAGLMAVDRDQVAFLNCLLLLGMAGWQVARRLWPEPRAALRTALELTPAALTGCLVLAIPMLLTLDLLAMSTRPEIDYRTAGYASLQPASLLTLLHANIYGSLQAGGYWGPGRLPWMALAALGYDWTDEAISHMYIGLVPLALLAVAFAIRKPRNPYRGFFIAAFIVSLLYAIGAYTPVFRFLYDWIPGIDLFRRPNDAAFLVNSCLAILVGFAAHAALTREPDERPISKFRLLLPILVLAGAAAAAFWIGQRFDHAEDVLLALVIAVPLLLIAGFAILWGRAKWRFSIFAGALVTLTAADLIWHHSGATFSAHPQEMIDAYQPGGVALADEIRGRLGSGTTRSRAEIFGLGGSWQNAALAYQLEQTLGYNPVRLRDYEAATGSLQNNHLRERHLTEQFTGYDSAVARALGIRVVATGAPIETILPPDATKSLTFLGQDGKAFLYQNKDVLPRVIVAPLGSPADAAAVAGTDVTIDTALSRIAVAGDAQIVSYRQSQIQIWVRLTQPGFLILHDIYHPAWHAWVDIQPAPVLRANGLFRAVALPPGEHNVIFTFDPLSWDELVAATTRVWTGRRTD